MTDWKRHLIRAGLDTLYFTGAHRALCAPLCGVGVVLTLHRVCPPRPGAFQPNRLLEISPDFLVSAIRRMRAAGVEFVSLDEVHRRLTEDDHRSRFVAVTLDDGFRDVADYAYPIFRRYEVPFTVFAVPGFADRSADLWWVTLEQVVAAATTISVEIDGSLKVYDCVGPAAKEVAFEEIYWWLRTLDEATLRQVVRDLAARHGVDGHGNAARLCLGWPELAALARDPLCTIGGHTMTHPRLRAVPLKEARAEMVQSLDEIAARLGRRPAHFAYPVGDAASAGDREFALARDLGLKTAVTTRPGVLFPEHQEHLTALPRVSLNGEFQLLRHLDVLLSGVPFAFWNSFRRLDVA